MGKITLAMKNIVRTYYFYSSPAKFLDRAFLIKSLRVIPDNRIALEIGGGNGQMARHIQKKIDFSAYISLDISPSEYTDIIGDAQSLPFLDNTFDCLITCDVLEHIPKAYRAINEMERTLKPSGVALISVPFIYGEHDASDHHRWTAEAFTLILEENGFENVRVFKKGGTFFSISYLLSNFIHSKLAPKETSWRTKGTLRKLYFSTSPAIFFPLMIISWICLLIDSLVDRNSANPSGLNILAQKTKEQAH